MKCSFSSLKFGIGLLLSLAFVSCGPQLTNKNPGGDGLGSTPSPSASPRPLADVNYFKTTRPTLLCGKAGWVYLRDEYVSAYCGIGCHDNSGFAPYKIAATNDDTAYTQAVAVTPSKWNHLLTANPFCVKCNLKEEGEVYLGFQEWLAHQNCN